MKKIKYISRQTTPELQEKLNLLRVYGYKLSYQNGFLKIYRDEIFVGHMKKSPHFVETYRNIKDFDEYKKIYYQFEKDMIILDIPYLGDYKSSGMKTLTGPINNPIRRRSNHDPKQKHSTDLKLLPRKNKR